MAKRRMFDLDVVDTDLFLEMPPSTQNLYFHLGMRADDDGFVSNPKKIMKSIGGTDDDFKILLGKSFLIPFENGVCVITHWKMNNYLRSDRYKETIYVTEKALLEEDVNGMYLLGIPKNNQWLTNGTHRVEENREEEKRIDKNSIDNIGQMSDKCLLKTRDKVIDINIIDIIDYLNEKNNSSYKKNNIKTISLLSKILKDYTLEDVKKVIDIKVKEWKGTDLEKFIRPETLFGNKFESYLNQKVVSKNNKGVQSNRTQDYEEFYDNI